MFAFSSFNECLRAMGTKSPLYTKLASSTAWNCILVTWQYTTCRYTRRGNGLPTLSSPFRRHLSMLSHSRSLQFDSIVSKSFEEASRSCRSSFLRLGKPLNLEGGLIDTKLNCTCCRPDKLPLSKSSKGNL
ncbi:Os06g0161350 [Oryza sativa Japonica Group]|uniref:Os06g0161350 protein n=1 Tax=Oryza sativa subsp. japonica TaxID=39947 RepID=A0A0P0WTA1_ORYSJ|nr:hypothetical protein EE612_032093 [Oryza sativa]BAS96290.1 Os06g0161350 [Oryza sativa Japonica Group]